MIFFIKEWAIYRIPKSIPMPFHIGVIDPEITVRDYVSKYFHIKFPDFSTLAEMRCSSLMTQSGTFFNNNSTMAHEEIEQ
jgi:hypothetical protein